MSNPIDNYAIKQVLENEVCSVHNKYAKIEITSEGIGIKNSCCEEFQLYIKEKGIQNIQEQTEASIKSMFKDFKI